MSSIGLMICDEGHRLKAASGNKTIRALKGIKTSRRVLLTGTPVQNNMGEYFSMIEFVNPHALNMDLRTFKKVFQIPIEAASEVGASNETRTIGESRLGELKNITEHFVLRRTAEINQRFLKPRTDVTIFVSKSVVGDF